MLPRLVRRLSALCVGILLPLGAQAQGLPGSEPQRLGLSAERLERIAPAVRDDIAAGVIPGAVMLIARYGRAAYFEAFGMREKALNAPMPRDAIFRLGSMTTNSTPFGVTFLYQKRSSGSHVGRTPVPKTSGVVLYDIYRSACA